MNKNIIFPAPTIETASSLPQGITDGWDTVPRLSIIPASEVAVDGQTVKVLPEGHLAFLSGPAIDAMIAHKQTELEPRA